MDMIEYMGKHFLFDLYKFSNKTRCKLTNVRCGLTSMGIDYNESFYVFELFV